MSVSGLVRIIFLSHTCIAMIDYYIIYILRKRRTNNTMLAEPNACIPTDIQVPAPLFSSQGAGTHKRGATCHFYLHRAQVST